MMVNKNSHVVECQSIVQRFIVLIVLIATCGIEVGCVNGRVKKNFEITAKNDPPETGNVQVEVFPVGKSTIQVSASGTQLILAITKALASKNATENQLAMQDPKVRAIILENSGFDSNDGNDTLLITRAGTVIVLPLSMVTESSAGAIKIFPGDAIAVLPFEFVKRRFQATSSDATLVNIDGLSMTKNAGTIDVLTSELDPSSSNLTNEESDYFRLLTEQRPDVAVITNLNSAPMYAVLLPLQKGSFSSATQGWALSDPNHASLMLIDGDSVAFRRVVELPIVAGSLF